MRATLARPFGRGLLHALRQVINNGAGWAAIQTGVLVMLAWIVASLLIVWRGFKWL